jgi:hypothetical protein
MKPVATLVIKQHLLRGAQCPRGFKQEVKDTNSIDFNLNDLSDPITRDKIINDQAQTKISGKGGVKILGNKNYSVPNY